MKARRFLYRLGVASAGPSLRSVRPLVRSLLPASLGRASGWGLGQRVKLVHMCCRRLLSGALGTPQLKRRASAEWLRVSWLEGVIVSLVRELVWTLAADAFEPWVPRHRPWLCRMSRASTCLSWAVHHCAWGLSSSSPGRSRSSGLTFPRRVGLALMSYHAPASAKARVLATPRHSRWAVEGQARLCRRWVAPLATGIFERRAHTPNAPRRIACGSMASVGARRPTGGRTRCRKCGHSHHHSAGPLALCAVLSEGLRRLKENWGASRAHVCAGSGPQWGPRHVPQACFQRRGPPAALLRAAVEAAMGSKVGRAANSHTGHNENVSGGKTHFGPSRTNGQPIGCAC